MSKANETEHERPKFDSNTREELRGLFVSALRKTHPKCRDEDADREAMVFVGCLEGISEYPGLVRQISAQEAEQRRKERVEAFANALDKLIDAGLGMDDTALGYAIWRGMSEVLKADDFDDEDRSHHERLKGFPSTLEAYEIQHDYAKRLRDFALGVRKAIKEMPSLDKESFEEKTAIFIEDYLGRVRIPFSTSDTGLAGKAFLAVMELAGKQMDRATYWLGKASKSERSWKRFIERIKERTGD